MKYCVHFASSEDMPDKICRLNLSLDELQGQLTKVSRVP